MRWSLVTSWLQSPPSARLPYVFVILELGSRRILQCNVTAHPSAEWTLQQFREGLSDETLYRFVIHDRDCNLLGRTRQGASTGRGNRSTTEHGYISLVFLPLAQLSIWISQPRSYVFKQIQFLDTTPAVRSCVRHSSGEAIIATSVALRSWPWSRPAHLRFALVGTPDLTDSFVEARPDACARASGTYHLSRSASGNLPHSTPQNRFFT